MVSKSVARLAATNRPLTNHNPLLVVLATRVVLDSNQAPKVVLVASRAVLVVSKVVLDQDSQVLLAMVDRSEE